MQVICTVLSADMVNPHDILCINGASAALAISSLPFLGPVGAVRIALVDGELVVNPTLQEMQESSLDLIVVGTQDALTMIEAGADQVPEETMLAAFELAHTEIRRICDAINDLRAQAGKPKWIDPALNEELAATQGDRIAAADRRARPRRRAGGRRRDPRRARPADHDGVDRGRHPPRAAAPGGPLRAPREEARRGRRGGGQGAVRDRPARSSPTPSRTRRS